MSYIRSTRILSVITAVFLIITALTACGDDSEKNGKASSSATGSAVSPVKTAAGTKTAAVTSKTTQVNGTPTAASLASMPLDSSQAGAGETAEDGTGQANDQVDGDYDSNNYADVDTGTGSDEEAGFVEGQVNLKGYKVTITGWGATLLPLPESANVNAVAYLFVNRTGVAEQKYNFKMEPVQPVITNGTLYYNSIINESMAGIKTADIMAVSSTRAIPELVSLGIMAPLDEYLDFESPLLKVCQHVYNGTMWKGKHYGLRNGMATNGSCLINYNKDIIEREGQPDILDLTENGQWNWETMLDIARNCTKDNNGDGILDQYGICSSNNWVFVSNLLYSNGSTGIDVRDGKLVYALDTPQAIRAIQYAIDLAFVHKVYIGNISPWRKATVAMLIINSLAENFRNLATYGLRSYATVLPKGPDVSESQNFGAQNYYAVSTLSEYKKEITQIMAEIFVSWDENGNDSPELEEALNKVVPYSWFWDPANNVSRYYSSEREFLIQKNAAKTFGLDYLGGITGLSGFLNTNLCTPVFNGSMSASQAVGAIADPVQSNYLDPYNK